MRIDDFITALRLGALLPLLLLLGLDRDQPATRPAPADHVRIMTYNIHHGAGTDGEIDLPRIAKIITDANVDLVALQEVDVGVERSGRVDEVAELARLTGMHAEFGKARDYQGGDYGQAILSRRPITSVQVHPLRAEGDAKLTGDAEERIAVVATIAGNDNLPELRFVSTHLHHKEESLRLAQARVLDGLFAAGDSDVIVAGDLNAVPTSDTIRTLRESWRNTSGDALTFPASKPDRKIDWVLVRKQSHWQGVDAQVLEQPTASDHRPVVVELAWRADQ